MFKHLLVPIDGSDLTDRAMTASLEFARQLGASVTGFVAEPVAAPPTPGRPPSLIRQETLEHDAMTAAHASSLLERFAGLAKETGVPFTGHHAQVPRVMVTHGRGAFGEFLFGSQTKAMLAGSSLPLLVLH